LASVTVGFSIPEEEHERLERLVQHFSPGNRSAFLRLAMKRMETLQRAEKLRDLQTYGVARRAELGLEDVPVEDIVHRVLSQQRNG
jgi:Arc/MetJ-type ribon-helix-helix transcriptional regulator